MGVFGLMIARVTEAQEAAKVPRLCILSGGPLTERLRSAFADALRNLGHVDGRTITIDYRYGSPEQMPSLVGDCLKLTPDIIIATTTPATAAAGTPRAAFR